MTHEEKRQVILDFIKFKEAFQEKEEEDYLAKCKRLGGMFSIVMASDEYILNKYLEQLS